MPRFAQETIPWQSRSAQPRCLTTAKTWRLSLCLALPPSRRFPPCPVRHRPQSPFDSPAVSLLYVRAHLFLCHHIVEIVVNLLVVKTADTHRPFQPHKLSVFLRPRLRKHSEISEYPAPCRNRTVIFISLSISDFQEYAPLVNGSLVIGIPPDGTVSLCSLHS